ncbi:MAG TPA: hypothetical protein VKU44_06200 [Terriglobia bacterium]|nr:hypothetical protein [Terriglobia bacterium]
MMLARKLSLILILGLAPIAGLGAATPADRPSGGPSNGIERIDLRVEGMT